MNRGRPIQFNPEHAVSAAMRVFHARGYEASSTSELLSAMQLSRSSLYQAFGNKEQLFINCLQRYRGDLLTRLRQQLDNAPTGKSFIEQLFLDTAGDAGSEKATLGCLIFNSATELGQRGCTPSREATASVQQIADVFRDAVARDQREGVIPADRDPGALADYLTASMGGLRTLLKTGIARDRAIAAVRIVLRAIG